MSSNQTTTAQLTKKQRRLLKKQERQEEHERMRRGQLMRRWLYVIGIALCLGLGLVVIQSIVVPPTATRNSDVASLSQCIQHTAVGMHIHSTLSIKINGIYQQIPKDIGITADCMRPVHTHDDSGEIHIEFPHPRDARLGEFFQIWDKQFNRACIFDYCSGEDGEVKMFVNGKENDLFENYVMHDLDKIEIRFE